MLPLNLLLLAAAGLFLALLMTGLRRVPEGTAFTVRRFGHYARTLGPGLRFALPMIERVSPPVALINHRIQLPLDSRGDSTQRAALYYQIVEPERSGDRLDDIDALVEQEARRQLDLLRAAAGSDVELLSSGLKQALNTHLASLGLRVTRCQLGA